MKTSEIQHRIVNGEDSLTQFKREAIGVAKLADEMVAFSNAEGGVILFGVDDEGTVVGLNAEQRKLVNRDLSSAASDGVRPAVYPRTEFHDVDGKCVLAVIVPEGVSKPYSNKSGEYWTKSGPDKRRITSREELQRLLQRSLLIHADELPVPKSSVADVDMAHFGKFVLGQYGMELDDLLARDGIDVGQLLNNLGLAEGSLLTLAGVMLFGKYPQRNRAHYMVKAVSFVGTDSSGTSYRDSEDISGTIADMYKGTMAFIKRNLHHVQAGQDFNSLGVLEIPEEAIQEIVANMFMHRDYFVESPWRVMVFDDRVEIVSPGCLPNHLTVEKMKAGISVVRNSTIVSFASKELPYRGLGTGIKRAVNLVPDVEIESDQDANWLKVTFKRRTNVPVSYSPVGTNALQKWGVASSKWNFDPEKWGVTPEKWGVALKKWGVAPEKWGVPLFCDKIATVRQPIKRYMVEMFLAYASQGVFGAMAVVQLLSVSKSVADRVMQKLRELDLVVPVKGQGKGKYRFTDFSRT